MCKLIVTSHTKSYFDSSKISDSLRRKIASKATLDRYFTLGGSVDHSNSLYLPGDTTTPTKSFPSNIHPQAWMVAG